MVRFIDSKMCFNIYKKCKLARFEHLKFTLVHIDIVNLVR